MSAIADIILLLSSGAATFYCLVLSRRLALLNDTKKGIGASISAMSEALVQMQTALIAASKHSDQSAAALSNLIEEAIEVRVSVRELLDEVEKMTEASVKEIQDAGEHLLVQIGETPGRSRTCAPVTQNKNQGSPRHRRVA